ncbi:DNA/RNA non-specific endonuclease [Flavobacterium crassostreae]|uniref:Endonuclease n=1 Tax=Flavobacterium crassostreae TaxID=1763534 RepID=A0A1B9DZS3_9FLAO|nr:endonuclease [Flavobacterium crassostreae]
MKTPLQFIKVLFIVAVLSSCKKEIKSDNPSSFSSQTSSSQKSSSMGSQILLSESLDYLPTSTTNSIIKHPYYTLSYNERAEQAEWLAYELKKSYIVNKDFKRPYFIEDPMVKSQSADWRNYKNSGYDKGHLCPAADMEFAKDAYNDTFYTSNIAPQNHDFNAGVWNRLEQKVRYWAQKYDGVYVVTAGVLNNTRKTIGKQKVLVPDYFYKIILDDSNGNYKMIAFLIPNQKSDKPLYSFVVSVDAIEKRTGIDFFPKLEDQLEDSLEQNSSYKAWAF